MISLPIPEKLSRLRAPRTWAAIFFGESKLDMAIARELGGEVSVLRQTSVPVPAGDTGDPMARWQSAAQNLRQQLDPREHRLVTAVACEDVLCHTLKLPSTEPGELKQMLDLQIDQLTPLPLEDVVYSFEPLEVTDGQTRVLVAIASKEAVNQRVKPLEDADLPPEVVTIDALAVFHGLVKHGLLSRNGKLNALVVLSETAANIIVYLHGNPVTVRSVILEKDGLAGDEGQTALCEEFRRTLAAAGLEHPQTEIGQLTFLTWSESLRGYADQIANRWGSEVEMLILSDGSVPPPVLSLCLQTASGEAGQLNLLPDEWRQLRSAKKKRRTLIRVGIAAGAVYLVALAVFLLMMGVRQAQSKHVGAEIVRLRPQYNAARQVQGQLVAVQKQLDTKYSALEVLREVSMRLPNNLKLNNFQFRKDQQVTLRGQAQTAEAVYDFISRLEQCELFSNVKPGTVQGAGGLTRFEILCSLKSAIGGPGPAHGT